MAERSSNEPEQAHHLNLDDDLRHTQEMLVEISHKWYDIGLQLKVKPNVLNRIQSQYSDPAVCLRLTLSDWLSGINPYPTWEALAQALESRSVKEGLLAKKVRETFVKSVTTTQPSPAPPTAHPIQQMASTRAQVAYTQQGYNPAYPLIAPTPSQQLAHLDPHNLAYFTSAPTEMPSDPPQRLGVPIPSFPTHSYQQTALSYHHPQVQMAMNPTPNPSHNLHSVPPHPHYRYTQSAPAPPQPHPIRSSATPIQDTIDPTYPLPTQRLPPLAYTPPQRYPIPSTPKQDPMDLTYHPTSQRPPPVASTTPQPHPIPSTPKQDPMDFTYHPTSQRPPPVAPTPQQPHLIPSTATPIQDPTYHPPTKTPTTHAQLPPYTPAPLMHPVDQYADYLRAYYEGQKLPVYSKWPPTASRKYIHLAVVKKNDVTKREADEFTMATLYGNIDQILGKKEPLEFTRIGIKQNGSRARMILVEGAPGIGKTTFAWKLARKWSKRKILQWYRLVVLLRLRDKRVREAKTIYDLLYYSDDDEVRRDVAKEVTRSHGESVLLLFEGFDELPRKLQTEESIFLDILGRHKLPKATVLITSRPSATKFLHSIFKGKIDQHIEILGFTTADVQSYVQSVIEDQQLHTKFSKYLKCYPHIRGLMYVPLNAVIVTEIYKDTKINESEEIVPTTLTELYTSLSRGMLLRYLKSHTEHGKREWKLTSFLDLPEEFHEQFHTICTIAFQGILKDEFIFDDLAHEFNTLDLMQSAPELYVDKGDVVAHNFFHLTLQEFLAAVHVSQQPTEEQLQYFLQSTPSGIQRERERQQQQERERQQQQEREREQQQRERQRQRERERQRQRQRERELLRERQQQQQQQQQHQHQHRPFPIQEPDSTIEPSTSTSEPLTSSALSEAPTILPQQGGIVPALQHRKRKPLQLAKVAHLQTTGSYPQQRLQSSKQPWMQRHQLQGLMGEPESTTEHSTNSLQLPMTLASCAPESELTEISTPSLPRPQVVPEQQQEEGTPLPQQETPQLTQTTPPLTTQDQGRLEPLQVMTPRHTTDSTPLPESPGMQHTADNGRLQLETPQLEPLVPQKLLSRREIPPMTNPQPVLPYTPPLSAPAGSLPYAVLTSSHFQNVVKFTAGLTKLKSLPTDSLQSILLQGEGDKQVIPLYSLHWLFEAQCISKYSGMIGETTTLSFNHSHSSMTHFDCFVLGFALSHINSTWYINIRSHIGDEGLEMMVSGMNYKEASLPTSLKSISLNLRLCAISSVGLSHLKEMPEQVATRITELDLSWNIDISKGVASLLSNLTSLNRLYLGRTSISPQEVEQLAELLSHSQPHNLEYLNLYHSLNSPERTSPILTALSHNTTLREIVLWEAHVSENNLSLLTSALRTNTTLRELYLIDCKINDNMVSEITSALCDNSTLQTLDLEGNAIGPRGATGLAEMLRRNTTLLELDVRGNSIGEEGTLKLATSLEHNETLATLWIDKEYKHSLPRELRLKTKNRIIF